MATARSAAPSSAADPLPSPGSRASVAALFAKARALKEKGDAKELARRQREGSAAERRNEGKARVFRRAWGWSVGFFAWLL
jgi:hypothetical protein